MTLACLKSLMAMPMLPLVICVVDNGSLGGESAALFQAWKKLCQKHAREAPQHITLDVALPLRGGILLTLTENIGFAGANNAAMQLLLADHECEAFWLLNNDTKPQPDALDALLYRLNQDDSIGMVGSTLVYAHESRLQTAAGTTLNRLTGISRFLFNGLPLSDLSQCDTVNTEKKLATITGASCLVRKEAVKRVGLMDDGYFLYYEDTDWSLKFKKEGYLLGWAQGSIVLHDEGGSSGLSAKLKHYSPLMDYLSYRNRLRLVLTHFPWAASTTLLSFAYAICKRLLSGELKKAWVVISAACNALRGEHGNPASKFK